jgi:seryl-tRNA synthetase
MLQIAVIRENQEKVINALAKRHMDARVIVKEIVQLDENRRNTQVELDNTLSESNRLSKDIGELMKNGEKAKAEILKLKTVSLRELGKELSEKLEAFANELMGLFASPPKVTAFL